MIKKEIIIPILSIILIVGTFVVGFSIENQELVDSKNSIEITNIKSNFEKDPWLDFYMGNITGTLKSNKTFDSVSGVIEYYDSNGALIVTNYMINPTKILEGQTYKITEQFYGTDNTKPASARIIIYNNDFKNGYQTNESIIFEKKINL